jgi:predicted small secreted protein
MMKIGRIVAVVFAAGVLVAGLSGCQKEEGPAERAGKAMDNAVDNAGKQIEKAGEKIQDAAKDAKK